MLRSLLAILVLAAVHLLALSTLPTQTISQEEVLRQRAQCLADRYLGRGKALVCVSLRAGEGLRRSEQTLLGERGFVIATQSKDETYRKSYKYSARSEKIELPKEVITTTRTQWTERISVAVLGPGVDQELASLIEAGLGLDLARGDRLVFSSTNPKP